MSEKPFDLTSIAAIEEIRALEARYAYLADHRRWDELAELFTENGWFRPLDAEGNEIARMSGRAEIAATLRRSTAGDVQPIHQLFSHEINLASPTTATAVWAMADLIFREDAPDGYDPSDPKPFRTMRGWGHYHVTYQKLDRRWRIATRTLTRTRLEYTY